ncbi:uncharacterized protein LOC124256096 [Haliotis rubra]|uniref:uncharacterized protein LOC124256096 n=1 Tax=Haliotis rubra TaxID=36100 RepID=UPI001EE60703|nr:uncharacterized protein LOC124256096 [Haliotis rubra]
MRAMPPPPCCRQDTPTLPMKLKIPHRIQPSVAVDQLWDFPDPVSITSTPLKPRPPPRQRQADPVASDTPSKKRMVEDDVLPTKCEVQMGMDIVGPMTALGDHIYSTIKSTADASTQTNLCFDDISSYTDDVLQNPKMLTKKLTMDNITRNNKSSKFYTGLSVAMLMLVFNWLKDKAARMTY